jgi:hypothetical protein
MRNVAFAALKISRLLSIWTLEHGTRSQFGLCRVFLLACQLQILIFLFQICSREHLGVFRPGEWGIRDDHSLSSTPYQPSSLEYIFQPITMFSFFPSSHSPSINKPAVSSIPLLINFFARPSGSHTIFQINLFNLHLTILSRQL